MAIVVLTEPCQVTAGRIGTCLNGVPIRGYAPQEVRRHTVR